MSLTIGTSCATAKYSLSIQPASNAHCHRTPALCDWEDEFDALLQLNALEAPTHAATSHADVADRQALECYESVDAARREAARLAADAGDMAVVLEQTEQQFEHKGRGAPQ
jgi:hypothetical protein